MQSGWTWDPTSDVPFNPDGEPHAAAYWSWIPGGSSQAVWNESWASIGTGGRPVQPSTARPASSRAWPASWDDHRGVPGPRLERRASTAASLVCTPYFREIRGGLWGVFGGDVCLLTAGGCS